MGLPLFPKIGVYDLGEVPSPTSSKPHNLYVHEMKGESGWVGKCPDVCPDPYTVLKEYICCTLAKLLGLPILDYCILKDGSRYWFAAPRIKPIDTFLERYFLQAENINLIPDVLAFNILVANIDLHEDNILLERISDDPLKHRIWIIDFSLALYDETDREGALLPENLSVYFCLPFDPANRIITGMEDFEPFLERLTLLSREKIFEVVQSIPSELIRQNHDVNREELANYIVGRQQNLKDMLISAKGYFPNCY